MPPGYTVQERTTQPICPLEECLLATSDLWRRGPDWLTNEEISVCAEEKPMPKECTQELKTKVRRALHSLVVVESPTRVGQLIQCEHFNSAQRLFQVTAYVLLVVKKFKKGSKE